MNSASLRTIAKQLIGNKRARQVAAVIVLVATVVVFIHFFAVHPEYVRQLRRVSIVTITVVLLFNTLLLTVLAGIYSICIRFCGQKIQKRENFLLTAYSSIINFFGPLQSGPGVRAVYLKTKLGIRLRDYTLATLLYYGLFAVLNIGFLLAGSRPWWQTLLALIAATAFSLFVIKQFQTRDKQRAGSKFVLRGDLLVALAIFTFLQIFVQACVFYFELHTVNPAIHFSQAISYTGAADLAIFVSLTPGAIGFRESFLVFSHSLHHISTANVLSANLIDRATYVLSLGLLFIVVLSMHAKDKLQITKQRHQPVAAKAEQ